MKELNKFIKRHWFGICIFIIVLLAFLLRFYNYSNRWGLAYDQAHDALIARYALEAGRIPLMGPFSSAGAFQTGGEWYWFLMLGTVIYPKLITAPWVLITLTYVAFVWFIILVGKEIVDKKFGLIVGILATVSTAQIAQSTSLTNQSPLAIISLFGIWSAIKYIKSRETPYLFFLGLSTSLGATVHLQGVAMLVLMPLVFIFTGLPSFKKINALFFGILLPLTPIILFDFNNNFVNIRGLMQYFLHDQYKVSLDVLGRRWLTYIGIFWPKIWSDVVGGNLVLTYLIILSLFVFSLYSFFKKSISKEWGFLIISFLIILTIVRYTRTPLFPSYFVFLHPFILIFTAWIIFSSLKKNKIFGFLMLVIIIFFTMLRDIPELKGSYNHSSYIANSWTNTVTTKFPNKKFAVYDFNYGYRDKSLSLVLFLSANKKIDDKGVKLGVRVNNDVSKNKHLVLDGKTGDYQLFNLSGPNAQLEKEGWAFVNPSSIYKSTEEWYQHKR